MSLFELLNPFDYLVKRQKAARDTRPEPEPRKGLFRFLNQITNKKQQRVFQLNAATLRRLANTDPITWAIRRTIKSFVNQAEWDIVIDTEAAERELDRWEEYALSYLSPYAINHTEVLKFQARYLSPDVVSELRGKLKELFNSPLPDAEKRSAIKWCFASATRRIREEAESHRQPVKAIFERPSPRGIESNWRALQELVVDDVLVFDAGVIVKNYNRKGDLAELYHLPGDEIRLYRNEDRTIPQAPEPAYVWEDKGILRAEFTWDELVYIMQSPQPNGYGMSPLEVAAYIITASIYADEYNIDYFKNSNVPPGVLDLGEEITEDQRVAFRTMWENEVRGRGGQHRLMFLSGTKNAKFIPMRIQSNRDMQMMDYLKWTTAIKTACYGLSPQDLGITVDFHRTTAETQRALSQARGVKGILHLLKTYYNDEIVKKEFPFTDVKFEWQDIDITDEKKEAEIDAIDLQQGVITRNERRKKLSMKPIDGGDTATITGQVMPVKQLEAMEESREDIEGQDPTGGGVGVEGQQPTPSAGPRSVAPAAGQTQAPAGPGRPETASAGPGNGIVTMKVNRRKPVTKQYEVIHNVVKELQDKGVEATVKISFDDSTVT